MKGITWLLGLVVMFGLSFGRMPHWGIGILLVVFTVFLFGGGKKGHTHLLNIGVSISPKGRLGEIHGKYKIWGGLGILCLGLIANGFWTSLFIAFAMAFFTVYFGGVPWKRYVSFLCIPFIFVLCSQLAILIEIGTTPLGYFDLSFGGVILSLTIDGQETARLLLARALCGIGCLYFVSCTTPMGEILDVLKRAKVPPLVMELMYLTYRYIFILLQVQASMETAAQARLGYANLKSSWRSFLGIASNLLVLAFRRAAACFDAMEARGYWGKIEFLTEEKNSKLEGKEIVFCLGLCLVIVLIMWIEK